jgi:DNA invertase Pin-like site-specific DNA recombinase
MESAVPLTLKVLLWLSELMCCSFGKLDRLARSMADLIAITSKLKAKGVELQILAMNLDTSTPTGKLMLNLMGSFPEFEREIMLARQRGGVAKA